MVYRVTDSINNSRLSQQIATQQLRLAGAQERLSTGKRINRPSDDPFGAAAVIQLRTSQADLSQFQRSTASAGDKLATADNALNSYESILDRVRTLFTEGITDTATKESKQAIATELDSIRTSLIDLGNLRSGGEYVFGGTRQDQPPFDVNGVPAATANADQLVQLEPNGTPIVTGVTAESLFSNAGGSIFATLSAAATALRGTGNPATDKASLTNALGQLATFKDQESVARTRIGNSQNAIDQVNERLGGQSLALEDSVQRIETADFAETAVQLTEAQRSLEAVLESGAKAQTRSLLDLIT